MTSSKFRGRRGHPRRPPICIPPPPPPPPPELGICDCALNPSYQETDPWMLAMIEIYTHAIDLPDIATCAIDWQVTFGELQAPPPGGLQDEYQYCDWWPDGQEGLCTITATITWEGGLVCIVSCQVNSTYMMMATKPPPPLSQPA